MDIDLKATSVTLDLQTSR